jgi:hypothetical protein
MKFVDKIIYSVKTLIIFLCNGVNHKCVNKCFLRYNYLILDSFHPDTLYIYIYI